MGIEDSSELPILYMLSGLAFCAMDSGSKRQMVLLKKERKRNGICGTLKKKGRAKIALPKTNLD